MEAESFAPCRANFCQGESSPELETIFQGRGVPFSPSHHATICVNPFRNEHCRHLPTNPGRPGWIDSAAFIVSDRQRSARAR